MVWLLFLLQVALSSNCRRFVEPGARVMFAVFYQMLEYIYPYMKEYIYLCLPKRQEKGEKFKSGTTNSSLVSSFKKIAKLPWEKAWNICSLPPAAIHILARAGPFFTPFWVRMVSTLGIKGLLSYWYEKDMSDKKFNRN